MLPKRKLDIARSIAGAEREILPVDDLLQAVNTPRSEKGGPPSHRWPGGELRKFIPRYFGSHRGQDPAACGGSGGQ